MMPKMGTRSWVLMAAMAAITLVLASCRPTPAVSTAPTTAAGPILGVAAPAGGIGKQLELRNGMRQLWDDHVTWTREAVVGVVTGAPDADASVARLMQNLTDIGNAVKPYYGNDAGDMLTSLLKDHISIAVDIVNAAKAGDTDQIAALQDKWNANADQIAALLNSANPTAWPLPEVSSALKAHLGLTLAEAQAVLRGDWAGSVQADDQARIQVLGMADVLSSGIISQFPSMFADTSSPAPSSMPVPGY